MKQDIAVDLLKIAATLAAAAISAKRATATSAAAAPTVETVFEDCLKSVEAHFADLTSGNK